MTMADTRSTSIAEVTPKAEDKGKDMNDDFLKYHPLDPNSAKDCCFDGLSHDAVMALRDYSCKVTVTN
jgi:hypothetical protein